WTSIALISRAAWTSSSAGSRSCSAPNLRRLSMRASALRAWSRRRTPIAGSGSPRPVASSSRPQSGLLGELLPPAGATPIATQVRDQLASWPLVSATALRALLDHAEDHRGQGEVRVAAPVLDCPGEAKP